MSSTHLGLHYHVVFGTKKPRANDPTGMAWRLARVPGWNHPCGERNCQSVGGVSDHVHLLIGLRATHRLADVLRELKSVSSGWVHEEIGLAAFAWQALAQKQNF